MTAYRFCRTDDVPLLVRAHNACISEPIGVPDITVDEFRRWMRELDVWCSSCMVAFEGSEPVGVLIAAKRTHASWLHRMGVRPEHRRRGHARHMLESLARKMAILEPRLLLAEVSEEFPDAMRLLEACGYLRGDDLVDHLADPLVDTLIGAGADGDAPGSLLRPSSVNLSELDAAGTLAVEEPASWLRSAAALRAVRDDLRGLAFVSDLRIEAWLLYRDDPESAERLVLGVGTGEGAAAGATTKALLPLLLAARHESRRPLRIPRLHSGELPLPVLAAAGFVPAAAFATYSVEAAPG